MQASFMVFAHCSSQRPVCIRGQIVLLLLLLCRLTSHFIPLCNWRHALIGWLVKSNKCPPASDQEQQPVRKVSLLFIRFWLSGSAIQLAPCANTKKRFLFRPKRKKTFEDAFLPFPLNFEVWVGGEWIRRHRVQQFHFDSRGFIGGRGGRREWWLDVVYRRRRGRTRGSMKRLRNSCEETRRTPAGSWSCCC